MPYFTYTLGQALDPSADPLPARARYLDAKIRRDLAIDPLTNDIEIPIRLLTGVDAILQRIWIRLRFWLGEWFLDTRLGVPWIERILVKGADPRAIRQILVKVVLSIPGVARVTNFETSVDTRSRTFSVTRMVVVLDDGTSVDAREGKPFIVATPDQLVPA